LKPIINGAGKLLPFPLSEAYTPRPH